MKVGNFVTWKRYNLRRSEYKAVEAVITGLGWLGRIEISYTVADGSIRTAWTHIRDLEARTPGRRRRK